MKIAPVSADLLIKLAIGAVLIGAGVYALRKVSAAAGGLVDQFTATIDSLKTGVSDAVDTVTELPGRVADYVIEGAQSGGAAYQERTTERPPSQQEFFGTYQSPLVNDSGMDFGALSG